MNLVQKNFLSVRRLLGVGHALIQSTTISPSLLLPGMAYPSIFLRWIATAGQAERASEMEVPSALGFQ